MKTVYTEKPRGGGFPPELIVKGLITYPATFATLPPSIPEETRNDFQEAATCLDAGCLKASMVMSRRALQRALKDKGCTKRDLRDQIKDAKTSGVIRPTFHALADEVWLYGNLSAHPDDDQLKNITPENAATLLEFTRLLLEDFYEVPAKADALKKSRTTP